MTARRLGGLDRLRGAALVLMLVHHLTDWFGGDARRVIPGWDTFALTDVAAPAFTMTLGASVPLLLLSRRRAATQPNTDPTPIGTRLPIIVLRRYGLLIPIGVGLRAALGFELGRLGVLETLGLCALAVAAVVTAFPPASVLALAIATTVAGPFVERAANERADWLSTHVLTGTFPFVVYLGLALLGAAAVPWLQRGEQRRPAALLAAAFVTWTAALVFVGQEPDRYPGDVSFIVPGLAGTLLLYVLVTSPRIADASIVGRLIGRAGAHTFGVFIGHYVVYAVLRATGLLHEVSNTVGLAIAVVVTATVVGIAPRVPRPPWSPRTGWARRSTAPEPSEAPAPTPAAPELTSRCG